MHRTRFSEGTALDELRDSLSIAVCGDINPAYHLEVQWSKRSASFRKHENSEGSETLPTETSTKKAPILSGSSSENYFKIWNKFHQISGRLKLWNNRMFQTFRVSFPLIFQILTTNFQTERLNFCAVRSARPFAPPDEAWAWGGGEPGGEIQGEVLKYLGWKPGQCQDVQTKDSEIPNDWIRHGWIWLRMAPHFMTSTITNLTKRDKCKSKISIR